MLTTVWALSDEDKAALAEKLGEAVRIETVTVSKGYDNALRWSVDADEEKVVEAVVGAGALSHAERESLRGARTIAELAAALQAVPSPSEGQAGLLAQVREMFPRGSVSDAVASALAPRLPKFVYFSEYHRLPGQVQLEGPAGAARPGRPRADGEPTGCSWRSSSRRAPTWRT